MHCPFAFDVLGVDLAKKAMKPPKRIYEIIQLILTDLQAMENNTNHNTRYHKDVTDLTPKNGKQKKTHLKKGLDYDIDENGNVWTNPNVKRIGLSIGEL
jgi:hypothetical protein